VACIYDIEQSIFDDTADALNAQSCNGRSPAEAHQEPQYFSDEAGGAVANQLRGAEQSTPPGTPTSHLNTKFQRPEWLVQCFPCR